MIQYPCPKCGKQLVLSRSDVGQVVLCNACGSAVRVSRNAASAPVPASPPPSPQESKPRVPARALVPGLGWWAIFAAAVIVAAGVPIAILLKRADPAPSQSGRVSNSANV